MTEDTNTEKKTLRESGLGEISIEEAETALGLKADSSSTFDVLRAWARALDSEKTELVKINHAVLALSGDQWSFLNESNSKGAEIVAAAVNNPIPAEKVEELNENALRIIRQSAAFRSMAFLGGNDGPN